MPAPETIRVAHVTPTLSRRGGGVASFLWELVQRGRQQGIEPVVAGLDDPLVREDTAAYVEQGIGIFAGRRIGPLALGYSPALRRFLEHSLPPVDLIHAHGLRMYPSYAARRSAQWHQLPRVVSPHGQLDPWILAYGRTRKRILGWLYEDQNLRTATCFHATAQQEARHIRAAGLGNPIAVVPIGIDAAEYDPPRSGDKAVEDRWPQLRGTRRLLFLSTIYPKKNLPLLARAWAWLHKLFPDWRLIVAGLDLSDERARAQKIVRAGGAAGVTLFTGPVSVEVKKQLLAGCHVYALPTQGENFGIAIGEALASGLPVITTVYTPWGEIRRRGCGWWIEPTMETLCGAMTEAMGATDEQRAEMGRRARSLIEQEYAWPRLVAQMRDAYLWVLGRGPKPAHVYAAGEGVPD